ncbi:type VI secretion system tube protein Hcp [Mesorhizobium sp. 1B3]|uniref:type VI secretion system tube protein Hcp n=1 Tax=Mesorhizobium sp. 1B3 TaxID=3243599 RepID=UPI003D9926B6
MKLDGFLKVPDITGPSVRDGHEDEIEIHGIEFEMVAPHDPNSLSRRGRVALGVITFFKHYDKASPYLKQALFQNKKLDEVVFSARRTIEEATSDYLVITLTDASVVHYSMKPDQDEGENDLIEERIGFAYKTIKFVYDDKDEVEMDVHVGV